MRFVTRLEDKDIRKLAQKHPKTARDEIVRVLKWVAARMEHEVDIRTPRGVGGAAGLAGSIFAEVHDIRGRPVLARWGTPLSYGEVVEKGRRPGRAMPPVDPLGLWVHRKLGVPADEARSVAFAIAISIARKGTKGKQMFARAWVKNRRWVRRMIMSLPGRIIAALEKKRK